MPQQNPPGRLCYRSNAGGNHSPGCRHSGEALVQLLPPRGCSFCSIPKHDVTLQLQHKLRICFASPFWDKCPGHASPGAHVWSSKDCHRLDTKGLSKKAVGGKRVPSWQGALPHCLLKVFSGSFPPGQNISHLLHS